MSASLTIDGVGKKFGPVVALKHVDLEVIAGERHALIGPNGSGKSTLFNLISGNFPPSSGTISIDGRRIDGASPTKVNRTGLGRSFQITRIMGGMTVRENIELSVMSRQSRRWSVLRTGPAWQEIGAAVDAIIASSPLAGKGEELAGALPYSQQRSLEICITIGTNPRVVLLDEPTAGMSREETRDVIEFIRTSTTGRTLLVVEHDMDVVFSLCDRVSVLAGGHIIATGTPDEIRASSAVQEAYLGGHAQ